MVNRWKRASAAVAMAAVVAVGCSATGETVAGDEPGDPTTSADGCSLPDGGVGVEAMLRFVADTPNNRANVTVADLRAYLDRQGTTLPDGFRDTVWFSGPVERFTATPLLKQEIQALANDTDALADEYGIGIGGVDQAVRFGEPPVTTELIIGAVDTAAVDAAVHADGLWSGALEQVEIAGQQVYTWGADGETQINKRSAMRDLGIGGRMWPGDGVAAFTRATAPMTDVLDACSGARPSLADDGAYAGIAERLDEFDGSFGVTLTDQVVGRDGVATPPGSAGSGPRGTRVEATTDASADVTPLEGVAAYGFASGPSDDPDEARIRLVIAAGTDAQARANEQRFVDQVDHGESFFDRRPWSERLRIDHHEVDGRFLVVELRAEDIAVLEKNLFMLDNLIVTAG